jgi:hypothetical protein
MWPLKRTGEEKVERKVKKRRKLEGGGEEEEKRARGWRLGVVGEGRSTRTSVSVEVRSSGQYTQATASPSTLGSAKKTYGGNDTNTGREGSGGGLQIQAGVSACSASL